MAAKEYQENRLSVAMVLVCMFQFLYVADGMLHEVSSSWQSYLAWILITADWSLRKDEILLIKMQQSTTLIFSPRISGKNIEIGCT